MGGKNTQKITTAILRRLFSKQVASLKLVVLGKFKLECLAKFNAYYYLNMYCFDILAAIKSNPTTAGSTEHDITICIQNWFSNFVRDLEGGRAS